MLPFLDLLTAVFIRYRKACAILLILLWCTVGVYLIRQPTPPPRMEAGGASSSSAYRADHIAETYFDFSHERVLALILAPDHKADQNLLNALRNHPDIAKVQEVPATHQPKHTIYSIHLRLDIPIFEAEQVIPELRKISSDWSKENQVETWITGQQAFFYDMSVASREDTAKTEVWGVLFAFVVLIFCFGSLLSAILPLLLGMGTLLGAQALVFLLGVGSNETSLILNSMLGLGLTIDYALFMVSRYREERLQHKAEDALKNTLRSTGRTLIYSALIMAISLLALMIPEVMALRGTLTNLLLVVALSLFNALTLLPVLLLTLDKYLGWPQALNQRIMKWHKPGRWNNLATHVTDRPWAYFLLSLSILFVLILPVGSLKLWQPLHQLAPAGSESAEGFERVAADTWKGQLAPITVVQKNGNLLSAEGLKANAAITQAFLKLPEVGEVYSLTSGGESIESYVGMYQQLSLLDSITGNALPLLKTLDTGEQVTIISVFPVNPLDITDTYTILDFGRDYKKKQQASIEIGGIIARAQSLNTELYGQAFFILILVSLGILLTLTAYLKSIVLPIKAAIMNFLPIFAAYGILVWAYMWGGIASHPGIITIVPVVLFCVVFGLSMDYEVLILSRIHEAWHDTGNVREAVIQGISRSGGIITGAALILLGVFSPGIFSSSPVVREISLGITATIILDATVVRLFLVPSFMMLMGEWNWWSPFQKKKENIK